jgi:hypothetical protein
MLEIDVNDEVPWKYGLRWVALNNAMIVVRVEGLDAAPVAGELVHATDDDLVITTPADGEPERGDAIWIPRARVITVTVPYRYADLQAERRQRLEADADLLERVRLAALGHLDQIRHIGSLTVRGPIPGTLARELGGEVSDTDVELALEILTARGDLPAPERLDPRDHPS